MDQQTKRIVIIISVIILALIIAVIIFAAVNSNTRMSNFLSVPGTVQTFSATTPQETNRIDPNTDIYIGTTKIFGTGTSSVYGILVAQLGANNKPIGSILRIINSSEAPMSPTGATGNLIVIQPVDGITLNSGGINNPNNVLATTTAVLQKISEKSYTRLK